MGTINYRTSDYITMGFEGYDYTDFEAEPEIIEAAIENNIDISDYISELISEYQQDDYDNIKIALEKHDFYYYHITLEPGYYEGCSLNIEANFPIAFDSWQDKRDAQKEITQIKLFLLECAGMGMVECYPGWCTTFKDYNATVKGIQSAIASMREEVKSTPTWSQYEKAGA